DASQDPQGAILQDDLVTGALVTLVVAFLLAAASAGIAQAAAVLDRRREIALQNLAGMPVELLDSVRRRSVLVPLLFVAVGSAATALVLFLPLVGEAGATRPGLVPAAGRDGRDHRPERPAAPGRVPGRRVRTRVRCDRDVPSAAPV